jgi:hypothetical protein
MRTDFGLAGSPAAAGLSAIDGLLALFAPRGGDELERAPSQRIMKHRLSKRTDRRRVGCR